MERKPCFILLLYNAYGIHIFTHTHTHLLTQLELAHTNTPTAEKRFNVFVVDFVFEKYTKYTFCDDAYCSCRFEQLFKLLREIMQILF